ncbi:DUF817 domain-containing protein [Demequina capsici]|uniref:DUF817 domain-containing protein n=1 Tax=Demequina capsici TaxID=3075620 RepID=A0AA96J6Z8_9MICO|nr:MULTISPECIES: DUF817 domain-containing protein [unclassified Demequina]WNM23820.1 DUF817 domain-containing protein [Demequina sp. OYTSA14]WNM26659.1 DUF817 domain-containing protein [Demequina sp. PMTSA13]
MTERDVLDPDRWRWRRLWRFGVGFMRLELQSLIFAIAIFAALAITSVVELPIPRYDALLLFAVVLTAVLWATGWETTREVGVILVFHLVGLALELFKVQVGSWVYPDDAWSKVAGVPLYAGFMYAAVGSYMVQAWRRFDLRVTGFRLWPMTVLALAAYANFFTHHWIPDLRWLIALGFLIELRGTLVHFSVREHRYRMPLVLAFVAIGASLWLAENAATLLGAWRYPDQLLAWTMVHVGKVGSWALLVSLSFVIVAALKRLEGLLDGHADDEPSVVVVRRQARSERRREARLARRADRAPDLSLEP